jgi:hypothetical protein
MARKAPRLKVRRLQADLEKGYCGRDEKHVTRRLVTLSHAVEIAQRGDLNQRIAQEDLDYIEKWYKKKEEKIERRQKAWLDGQKKSCLQKNYRNHCSDVGLLCF